MPQLDSSIQTISTMSFLYFVLTSFIASFLLIVIRGCTPQQLTVTSWGGGLPVYQQLQQTSQVELSLACLGLYAHSLTNHVLKEMKCSQWPGLELGSGHTFQQNTGTKSGWGRVFPRLNQDDINRRKQNKNQTGKTSRLPILHSEKNS